MKKILIAHDGNFSEGAFEFARRLNELDPILLTGAFLPQVELANNGTYADAMSGQFLFHSVETEETKRWEENIQKFEYLCKKNNIVYHIHKNYSDFSLPELKRETRFADLLIISSETFYEETRNVNLNDFLQVALRNSECPIIVVPENFDFPESNILAYDGTESSVYAIKQFIYLLPELCDNKTLLVYSEENTEKEVPYDQDIREYSARHFNSLAVLKIEINPKKYFSTWVTAKKKAFLVTGSYGRSRLSELFNKSFVSEILNEHKMPVFIAHK